MKERFGNIWQIWQQPNQILLVTTNNVITNHGLVMGAGIALEAKERLPDLPKQIAYHYKVNPRLWNEGDYCLYIDYNKQIGCIQTKRDWRDKSPIELVIKSIQKLNREARMSHNEHITYNLPRPATGLGGLSWDQQVKEICEILPNTCIIWSKERV